MCVQAPELNRTLGLDTSRVDRAVLSWSGAKGGSQGDALGRACEWSDGLGGVRFLHHRKYFVERNSTTPSASIDRGPVKLRSTKNAPFSSCQARKARLRAFFDHSVLGHLLEL